MESIFSRILKGEVPASFVYRDDRVSAFMDVHPINPGHVLVVPHEPAVSLSELSEEAAAHLLVVGKKIATALRASELLRDYHYGAVDNRGNLILLKHPCDVFSKRYSPLQLLFKRLLWRLPQRPRFLLNKPQMRERVKRPARVSTRALQPVRVVARFE